MENCIQDELKVLCIETIKLLDFLKEEGKITNKEYLEHLKEKKEYLEKLEKDEKGVESLLL
ncbi:MAG: hypothetical protein KZY61_11780 [Clostridiaceae bacterium]|nr:hypothetical protein [Clostridiaceae bacterium]MBW4860639.1 hypothetical protein [Clostridiaceae bacterium]MBW4869309.1 hypothetical protein [Clostridiaceae bacterium]HHV25890.1 hypothetical protein [Tissierellia bacterium]